MDVDSVWTVCEICGALVGRARMHADWHNPPEPETGPELDPETETESENKS